MKATSTPHLPGVKNIVSLYLIFQKKCFFLERSAPWYLFIMIIVIAFPMFVMLLALFLLCFTRTRKVFRLDLWEWWKQKFAEKEQDPEQVSELSYADSNSDGEKKETENFGF